MAKKATVLSFFSLFLLLLITGAHSGTFTLKNNCPFTVWPGTLADLGKPQLSTTGFELSSGCSISINALPGWSGQFWARTQCTVDPTTLKFSCLTGDCGSGQVTCNGAGAIPPVTLTELVIADQNSTIDYYQISLVGGFNLPVSVWPEGGSGTCDLAICKANVNVVCPPTLAVIGDGGVIACRSACVAFGQPQYCCTGLFGSAETCLPTEYSNIFKSQCPKAITYAFDHKLKSFSCSGGASYVVTFCP